MTDERYHSDEDEENRSYPLKKSFGTDTIDSIKPDTPTGRSGGKDRNSPEKK